MSQAGTFGTGGGGSGDIVTLTGNTGGAVSPDGSGNINVVGDGTTANVVGDNSTHTLTISSISGPVAVTYVNTTPYVVLPTDYFLDVDCSGGAITIQIPDTAVEGQSFIVKDLTGSAATNNITVTTVSGSTTIDNSTFYTIATNYYSIQITGNSQSAYDIALDYNPGVMTTASSDSGSATPSSNAITFAGGTGISTSASGSTVVITSTVNGGISEIDGNSGNVTGSTVVITTGASNAQGTAKFTGSGTIMTFTFSDSGNNIGIGTSSLASPSGSADNNAYGVLSGNSISAGATYNCLFGTTSGYSITSGSQNHAFGTQSLDNLLTGINNIAIGYTAGSNLAAAESNNIYLNNTGTASENNVLRIGSGTGTSAQQLNSSYISGIQTIAVTGNAVLVSSSDQLGVAASSRRFKNDIQAMDEESSSVYKLRPVTFVWNEHSSPGLKDAPKTRQTGLIAEEVHEVMPSLVILDKDQQPFSVKYEDLPALLLNELQKLKKSHDELALQVAALKGK